MNFYIIQIKFNLLFVKGCNAPCTTINGEKKLCARPKSLPSDLDMDAKSP